MAVERLTKHKTSKALVEILGLLIVILSIYLVGLPLYPKIEYYFWSSGQKTSQAQDEQAAVSASSSAAYAGSNISSVQDLSVAANKELGNRLIVKKIGIDTPIIESQNASWALNRGAWRLPETSTPDKGGNTAISGHRFKYLPPNNLTFYLLDKLAAGDILIVFWDGKEYNYRVASSKIVLPTDVSVIAPTEKPTLTLITCDPIFSQKNRLIVTGELIQ